MIKKIILKKSVKTSESPSDNSIYLFASYIKYISVVCNKGKGIKGERHKPHFSLALMQE